MLSEMPHRFKLLLPIARGAGGRGRTNTNRNQKGRLLHGFTTMGGFVEEKKTSNGEAVCCCNAGVGTAKQWRHQNPLLRPVRTGSRPVCCLGPSLDWVAPCFPADNGRQDVVEDNQDVAGFPWTSLSARQLSSWTSASPSARAWHAACESSSARDAVSRSIARSSHATAASRCQRRHNKSGASSRHHCRASARSRWWAERGRISTGKRRGQALRKVRSSDTGPRVHKAFSHVRRATNGGQRIVPGCTIGAMGRCFRAQARPPKRMGRWSARCAASGEGRPLHHILIHAAADGPVAVRELRGSIRSRKLAPQSKRGGAKLLARQGSECARAGGRGSRVLPAAGTVRNHRCQAARRAIRALLTPGHCPKSIAHRPSAVWTRNAKTARPELAPKLPLAWQWYRPNMSVHLVDDAARDHIILQGAGENREIH